MRDVVFHPLSNKQELVISTDCAGGIGNKEADTVKVSDEMVSYFTMRVALMEIMAVGGHPRAVILSNFTGDQVWDSYVKGIKTIFEELEQPSISILGSSETNFPLVQSALGLTVVGIIDKHNKRLNKTPPDAAFAVIGEPLVGSAVIEQKEKVAPLSLFASCLQFDQVFELVPIGSKGILSEFKQLLKANDIPEFQVHTTLNLTASSGPATSFLISYHKDIEDQLKKVAGDYFHRLKRLSIKTIMDY